jgi:curved DNA-binding protein CbpA
MMSSYDRLGISPAASPAEIKAAYHAKLREFPAHTHPVEFKDIRAAYEEIRKGQASEPFFKVRPLEANLDETALAQLKEATLAELKLSLNDMIRETF